MTQALLCTEWCQMCAFGGVALRGRVENGQQLGFAVPVASDMGRHGAACIERHHKIAEALTTPSCVQA